MLRKRFRMPVAVHLFLLRGEEVLLLRRFQTGYEDGRYSVIAGHLDGGETVIAAAIREAREEAGITLAPDAVRVVGAMHRRSNDERIDFFVAAEHWAGTLTNAEPHKCDELRWAPLDALPETIIPYVRRALANFRAARWYDSYGFGASADGGGA